MSENEQIGDDPPETDREAEGDHQDLATNVGANLAGALLGLGVGGPIGGLIGAVIPPAVVYAANRFTRRRTEAVLAPAIKELGAEEIAKKIDEDPLLFQVSRKALSYAIETPWEEHVQALAMVLRDGFAGQHDPDEVAHMMDAIGTMTPDGAAVLRVLVEEEPNKPPRFSEREIVEKVGNSSLSRVRVALRQLEAAETAETGGTSFDGGETWSAAALAQVVLDYIRRAGAMDADVEGSKEDRSEPEEGSDDE